MGRRTLVVEDDADIVELVTHYLEREGFTVESVGDGRAALDRLRTTAYDLLILDVQLPGLDGLAVCAEARRDKRTRSVPIVMLTARGDEADRVVGLEMGADDYVVKPFSPKELVARVRALFRRLERPDEGGQPLLTRGDLEVDPDRHTVRQNGEPVHLTAKEFALLVALIEAKGRVLSRQHLLESVWGYSYAEGTRTVDVHVRRLREKMTGPGPGDPDRQVPGLPARPGERGVSEPAAPRPATSLGLRARMVVTAALATAAALAAVLLLTEPGLRRRAREQVRGTLMAEARLMARVVEDGLARGATPDELDPVVDAAAKDASARVTVLALDGRVLADSVASGRDLLAIENHRNRPEVQSALATGLGFAERHSATAKRGPALRGGAGRARGPPGGRGPRRHVAREHRRTGRGPAPGRAPGLRSGPAHHRAAVGPFLLVPGALLARDHGRGPPARGGRSRGAG